jgi:3-carboxy-cis,cis-muconate cycloisomerase
MSFTLQQSPFLTPLLGDQEIMGLFSVEADLAAMLEFEVALAVAQAKFGFIPPEAAEQIAHAMKTFTPDHVKLANGIARDGMVVPSLVLQLKASINTHVHYGATSQDVIDTSLMLRAKKAVSILLARFDALLSTLEKLSAAHGKNKLMARTRMQQALPFTVANRIASWSAGVHDARDTLVACRFPLQFGGPIGVLVEFDEQAAELKKEIAKQLGLVSKLDNWHSARGPIVALGNAVSQLTGAMAKIGADYCLMAQNEFAEVKLVGGGSSSAMHHKQNPVLAETLVTLARFNATLISGLHQSMVHEQERSGAAWTLEWMVLPQMIVAAGASTRIAGELLSATVAMGQP